MLAFLVPASDIGLLLLKLNIFRLFNFMRCRFTVSCYDPWTICKSFSILFIPNASPIVIDRNECISAFFYCMHNLNAAAAVMKRPPQQFQIIKCEYFEMKTKWILGK